jgi:hypothetical protein
MNETHLPSHLQKLINLGESGTDIMHGELKNLMVDTETRLSAITKGPGKDYLEGVLDAYVEVYKLTYQLAFAINDRTVKLTNRPATDIL